MSSVTYLVDGMTCAHCVAAVSREVSALPGVDRVSVDLSAGSVLVEGAAAESDVAAAVADAGYALSGRVE